MIPQTPPIDIQNVCWLYPQCLFVAQQYYTEDDDDDDEDIDSVDLLNFFIAMTLLAGAEDDEEDDFDFPFSLNEEYGFWAFSFFSVPETTEMGQKKKVLITERAQLCCDEVLLHASVFKTAFCIVVL